MSQEIFNVSVLSIFPTKPKGKHKMKFTVTTNSVDNISLTYTEFKYGWKLSQTKGMETYSPFDATKIIDACNYFLNGKLTPTSPENPYVKNKMTNSFQIIF